MIIPGYCVNGTLGNKLLRGVKNININKKTYDVKMNVTNMSFSAHADSKGKPSLKQTKNQGFST